MDRFQRCSPPGRRYGPWSDPGRAAAAALLGVHGDPGHAVASLVVERTLADRQPAVRIVGARQLGLFVGLPGCDPWRLFAQCA